MQKSTLMTFLLGYINADTSDQGVCVCVFVCVCVRVCVCVSVYMCVHLLSVGSTYADAENMGGCMDKDKRDAVCRLCVCVGVWGVLGWVCVCVSVCVCVCVSVCACVHVGIAMSHATAVCSSILLSKQRGKREREDLW